MENLQQEVHVRFPRQSRLVCQVAFNINRWCAVVRQVLALLPCEFSLAAHCQKHLGDLISSTLQQYTQLIYLNSRIMATFVTRLELLSQPFLCPPRRMAPLTNLDASPSYTKFLGCAEMPQEMSLLLKEVVWLPLTHCRWEEP